MGVVTLKDWMGTDCSGCIGLSPRGILFRRKLHQPLFFPNRIPSSNSTQSLVSLWKLFWSFKALSDILCPHLAHIPVYNCIWIVYLDFNHVCISYSSQLPWIVAYLFVLVNFLRDAVSKWMHLHHSSTHLTNSSWVPTCAKHCFRSWEIIYLSIVYPSIHPSIYSLSIFYFR